MSKRRRLSLRLSHAETELSRRYLRTLEEWIPVGVEYFADWPDRPNCGHFFGGCHWYGQETMSAAFTFAVAASSPELDERRAGCRRADLRAMALKAVRYLCFTHDTGPADCVRPKTGLGRPENCNTKWGEKGKGFFPESQCGHTIAKLGMTAMLLGRLVDDETRAMVDAIHADYAGRFAPMWPLSKVYFNTQLEEDAWTATGLASAALYLRDRPDADGWRRAAYRWMFYTATCPQDTRNHAPFDDDDVTIAAKTHDLVNVLPDYMVENHGMVHPSYTGCTFFFLAMQAIIHSIHGEDLPPEAMHNRDRIYAQLRRLTDRTGSLHPAQGMDWPYLFTDPGCGVHAAAAVLLKDPVAARLERRALATFEQRQAGNGGRMYSKEVGEVCHDIQDPIIMRENLAGPALTYLLHRVLGDGARPAADAQAEEATRGVAVLPHSSFVFHRHRRGQTSFSWRNSIMALPLTRDGIYTIAPATDSLLGRVEVVNQPDSHDFVSLRLDTQADGFAAALTMDRAQGSVRQDVLFASLPSGSTLLAEAWTANRGVTVARVEQGFLRVINETFSAVKGNCNGYRKLYTPAGEDRFEGGVSRDPESDRVVAYDHPEWLNIDGRMGIVFAGNGRTVYHNRHHYPTWWAVADDLVLSRIDRRQRVAAGDSFANLNALLVPGCRAAKTSDLSLLALSAPKRSAALVAEGCLAAANFAAGPRSLAFTTTRRRPAEIPIFPGLTQISSRRVAIRLRLQPGEAILRRARITIEAEGSIEATASDLGPVIVRNTGRQAAKVRVAGQGRWRTVRAGGTIAL